MNEDTLIRNKVRETVRAMPWTDKMAWANATGRWEGFRDEATSYLVDTTPAGYGISSSDRNHVAMGLIEDALVSWLTGEA